MIPHLRVPFVFGAPPIEQDSHADVSQCVFVVCSFPVGTRTDKPEFGVTDQTFHENGIDRERLQREVERWEPRAEVLTSQEIDELLTTVSVDFERR